MGYRYKDSDGGSDANGGTTWADAKLTHQGVLAVASAGDIIFEQGAADDTVAASRTFTSPGTTTNPCLIIAVKDGTTNEGASIVESDLAVTRHQISNTGPNSDITFAGSSYYYGFLFTSLDRTSVTGNTHNTFENSQIKTVDQFFDAASSVTKFINTDYESGGGSGHMSLTGEFSWYGGIWTYTGAEPTQVFLSTGIDGNFVEGVDFTAITSARITSTLIHPMKLVSCQMPASFTLTDAAYTRSIIEAIACSNATSISDTASVQDYSSHGLHGTVDVEVTNVRTGAADDGASGVFCYAMTPFVNTTLESAASLRSPWLSTWVTGGSEIICTVFIANDGGVDYNVDDVWVKWITPDDGDTSKHDITFDPTGPSKLLDNSTPVADDAVSSWVTAANAQKFVKTFTPGYEGWVQARVHFAKRFAASPDTLYLDPKIEVT